MDRGIRAVQRSRERHSSQLVAMPNSSSNSSDSVGCEFVLSQGHKGNGVKTMKELQDVTDEGNVSSTAVEVFEVLRRF